MIAFIIDIVRKSYERNLVYYFWTNHACISEKKSRQKIWRKLLQPPAQTIWL